MTYFSDLIDPTNAYLFGFAAADGHLCKKRKNTFKLIIEINKTDHDIIQSLHNALKVDTKINGRSYKVNDGRLKFSHTTSLSIYNNEYLTSLMNCGFICGAKSFIVNIPNCSFSNADFWRGIIDGDGSLIFTKDGRPQINLTTASIKLAKSFTKFVFNITGTRKQRLTRSSYDNCFNLSYTAEDAQKIVKYLYYPNCIALNRKYLLAQEIIKWKRPDTMRKLKRNKVWTKQEDEFIMNHSILESVEFLRRTYNCINNRRYILRNAKCKNSQYYLLT